MGETKIKSLFWPGWWYPCPNDPISGIFIKKHAEAVARFCDVSVLYIVPDPGLTRKKYHLEYAEENGVKTLRIYYKPSLFQRSPVLSKLFEFLKYVKAGSLGLRFLEEKVGKPDIVHVNVNPPAGLVYLLSTRLRKLPYIFTEHWSGYLPANRAYRGFLRKKITRFFVKRARAVTTVSEDLKRAMLSHGLRNQYYVVPNVVDTEVFRLPETHTRKEGESETNRKKAILHVSGLVPVKNIPGIIETVRLLSAERNDFRLDIIGDSPYRESFEEMAANAGLLDRVIFFLGRKGVEEVARYMRDSDFLLLFSNYENSPCVIVEAMASGLPVVVTQVGGIPELVSKNTGILVKTKDEEALAAALKDILDNPGKFDRAAIRKYAVDRFSYPVIGGQFYKLYKQILKKPQ